MKPPKDRRAAHFLLIPELAYSPPNDALVNALLELGYEVDLFAPGEASDTSRYGPRVRACSASYGYRWMARNLLSPRWSRYSLFAGTTEDPMAVAGLLARLYRRPCVTMADEIKTGSFSGNRGGRWKALCRFGMRARGVTVVNDAERVSLQRDYAGLSPQQPVIIYPGCFRSLPVPWDRAATRRARGIPEDALVICYSGVLNSGNGAHWLAEAIAENEHYWFWGQIIHPDPLVMELLRRIQGNDRLVLEPERLSWQDAWASMSAADIGIVVYLQDGPQFQHMGIASNRLCMFLSMGVPVIASRQPSFRFIEDYDCGVMVSDVREFTAAIEQIGGCLPAMRENALRCTREYIRAPERAAELKQRIAGLMG